MAIAKTIKFDPAQRVTLEDYDVYLRDGWKDAENKKTAWTEEPNLACPEAVWSMAPSLPTAALQWRYGQQRQVRDPGGDDSKAWRRGEARDVKPLDADRHFVKIRFGDGRVWAGVWQLAQEEQLGAALLKTETRAGEAPKPVYTLAGLQTFTCYGLEKLLDERIVKCYFETSRPETRAAPTGRLLTFNAGGKPNRGSFELDAPGGGAAYCFAAPDVTLREDWEYWTTKTIVQYLVAFYEPLNEEGKSLLDLSISDDALELLPDWDRPTVSLEGKTAYSVLSELIDRRRLMGWRLRYTEAVDGSDNPDPTGSGDSVELHAVSYTDVKIDKLPANLNTRAIEQELDPLTTITFKQSDVATYDQVVFRGEQIRCVCTLQFKTATGLVPGSYEKAWTASDESLYESGPTLQKEWPKAGRSDRQILAARFRGTLPLVFAAFRVPEAWRRQVVNGLDDPASNVDVFPHESDSPPAVEGLEIERTLPLLEGVDYSGSLIADDKLDVGDNQVESPPLVLLKRVPSEQSADDDLYAAADSIGLAAGVEAKGIDEDNALSCSLHVDGRTIMVHVRNMHQHALDGAHFSSVSGVDEKVPQYDCEKMLFTVSFRGDRAEAIWPDDDGLRWTARVGHPVRRKYLDAPGVGETFVCAGTVVGVTAGGELKRVTKPGFIPVRDSENNVNEKLLALAKVAARWYTKRRMIATIATRRFNGPDDLELGDFIVRCGEDGSRAKREIDGPLTQIKYTTPLAEPGGPANWQVEYVTWHGEIDAVRLKPGTPGFSAPPPAAPSDHRAGTVAHLPGGGTASEL